MVKTSSWNFFFLVRQRENFIQNSSLQTLTFPISYYDFVRRERTLTESTIFKDSTRRFYHSFSIIHEFTSYFFYIHTPFDFFTLTFFQSKKYIKKEKNFLVIFSCKDWKANDLWSKILLLTFRFICYISTNTRFFFTSIKWKSIYIFFRENKKIIIEKNFGK